MGKWEVLKVLWWSDKPWRAFAPKDLCQPLGSCQCKSFATWSEAMAYVGGYVSAET